MPDPCHPSSGAAAPWAEQRTIGNAMLYLGDCREVLPHLGHFDAIVSDPPYGIGYVRGPTVKQSVYRGFDRNKNAGTVVAGDDAPFDPAFLLTRAPSVLLWGADHFYPRLPDSGRFLAWNKLGGLEPWDSFADVEFAWHSADRAARIFSFKWKGLACVKKGEANGRRWHPTQKPVALMAWCLEQAGSKPGDLVCDPFMGSGTTGVAAARTGRRFVGIEIERTHFEVACERIAEAHAQGDLFNAADPGSPQVPPQGELLA